MTKTNISPASFKEFLEGFNNGFHTDLTFKFLDQIPEPDAAEFFITALQRLTQGLDSGDISHLLEHVIAWQCKGYDAEVSFKYEESPFTPLCKPLTESRKCNPHP